MLFFKIAMQGISYILNPLLNQFDVQCLDSFKQKRFHLCDQPWEITLCFKLEAFACISTIFLVLSYKGGIEMVVSNKTSDKFADVLQGGNWQTNSSVKESK